MGADRAFREAVGTAETKNKHQFMLKISANTNCISRNGR